MNKTTTITILTTALLSLGIGVVIGNYYGHKYTINTGTIADWLLTLLALANLYFLKLYVDDTSKIRKNFEGHFFNLISGYHSLVQSLKKKLNNHVTPPTLEMFEGVYCLKRIAELVPTNIPMAKNTNETTVQFNARITSSFDPYYLQHSEILGHYFRYIYNLLNYIDKEGGDKKNQEQFINIFKAHLSDFEFELIFLNALTPRGNKFKELIEKHSIFENWFRDGAPKTLFQSIKSADSFNKSAFTKQS